MEEHQHPSGSQWGVVILGTQHRHQHTPRKLEEPELGPHSGTYGIDEKGLFNLCRQNFMPCHALPRNLNMSSLDSDSDVLSCVQDEHHTKNQPVFGAGQQGGGEEKRDEENQDLCFFSDVPEIWSRSANH